MGLLLRQHKHLIPWTRTFGVDGKVIPVFDTSNLHPGMSTFLFHRAEFTFCFSSNPCGPNFLTFVLRLRENSGKNLNQEIDPTGDRIRSRCVSGKMLPLDYGVGRYNSSLYEFVFRLLQTINSYYSDNGTSVLISWITCFISTLICKSM